MTLNKTDRTKLIQEMEDKFVTKEELATAMANLVQQLPSKEEQMTDKLELLAAINKREENDAAHKQLHHDLGEDVPKLTGQIKHLYDKLEIDVPVNLSF